MSSTDRPVMRRNQLINFLPIVTFAALVFVGEGLHMNNVLSRALAGVHLVVFYFVSILMVFTKNLNKWVILLILFPGTAVFTYIVLLFLRPATPGTKSARELALEAVSRTIGIDPNADTDRE